MKPINLNFEKFGNVEVLTRDQLKNVIGGQSAGPVPPCPEGTFYCTCTGSSGTVGGCASSVEQCWDAC